MANAETVRGAFLPHSGHGFFLELSLKEESSSKVKSQVMQ
jgi:hypothetical protein